MVNRKPYDRPKPMAQPIHLPIHITYSGKAIEAHNNPATFADVARHSIRCNTSHAPLGHIEWLLGSPLYGATILRCETAAPAVSQHAHLTQGHARHRYQCRIPGYSTLAHAAATIFRGTCRRAQAPTRRAANGGKVNQPRNAIPFMNPYPAIRLLRRF